MQRRPAGQKNREVNEKTRRPTDCGFRDKCFRAWPKNSRKSKKNNGHHIHQRNLPAVAVWRADIGSGANQEVHHIVMASANGVVKGGDALVVGLAGVTHLRETLHFGGLMLTPNCRCPTQTVYLDFYTFNCDCLLTGDRF